MGLDYKYHSTISWQGNEFHRNLSAPRVTEVDHDNNNGMNRTTGRLNIYTVELILNRRFIFPYGIKAMKEIKHTINLNAQFKAYRQ